MEVLRFCHRESLESFYYLSSVPATIGGAVAMNAGRGRKSGGSIYDFVRRVRYYDLEAREVREISGAEAVKGYRSTIFTGATSKVVLEVGFEFRPGVFAENPIEARNPEGMFDLIRIGDAVHSRNIHAGIYDALRYGVLF